MEVVLPMFIAFQIILSPPLDVSSGGKVLKVPLLLVTLFIIINKEGR